MQGEDANCGRGRGLIVGFGNLDPGGGTRCTSSADGNPGCSTVLIDSPIQSTATCGGRAATSRVGARSCDGKTRRYVRSSEPRLRWSEELHRRFMAAAQKLGGAEKATPKAILLEMNVRGLKIAHVKSHLQMCRSPRSGKSFGLQPESGYWRSEDPEVWNSPGAEENRQEQILHGCSVPMQATRVLPPQSATHTETFGPGELQCNSLPGEFSADRSVESSPRLSQILNQFDSNMFSKDLRNDSEADHLMWDTELFPNVLSGFIEGQATKSRDMEISDDCDDGMQSLSDKLLASNAVDASRLYDSAELLAHNLLMAMRERKLLEAQSHRPRIDTPHSEVINPEVPLELTMSVGAHNSSVDVRSEILTLDLTDQLNRRSQW